MTTEWYVHDILQPLALPLMQRLAGAKLPSKTKLSTTKLPNYHPSLAWPIPRFVSNRANLRSFEMSSWASHEFE
ncbi:hypothetical protein TNCV_1680581 [Trichonephila clavipes]|nr:hypothetical protein TNCV_1680581 [Trichonephila clavipes]